MQNLCTLFVELALLHVLNVMPCSILAANITDHGQDREAYLTPYHLRYDSHKFGLVFCFLFSIRGVIKVVMMYVMRLVR